MLMNLIDNNEIKVASSIKHNQFKTRVHKPEPFYDQNGQDPYPIYDQLRKADEKPHPLGLHTIREDLLPRY